MIFGPERAVRARGDFEPAALESIIAVRAQRDLNATGGTEAGNRRAHGGFMFGIGIEQCGDEHVAAQAADQVEMYFQRVVPVHQNRPPFTATVRGLEINPNAATAVRLIGKAPGSPVGLRRMAARRPLTY